MKIILIGFMGSGKSAVAKKLGSLFHLPVFEMDEGVLKNAQVNSMHEVFEKGGESLLRKIELQIAYDYVLIEKGIISTGGGVGVNPVALNLLKQSKGKVFFLNATFETIILRIKKGGSRPLFTDLEALEAIYRLRNPLYLKHADEAICVEGKSVEEVSQEIADRYHLLQLKCNATMV